MDIGKYSFKEFMELAEWLHSFPAPGILIGGFMVEKAKSAMPKDTLYEAFVETGKCLPDAVQLLTPCSIGNGWMRIVNLGKYALSLYDKYNGDGFRSYLDPDKLADWPELRSWFLKEKPKAEQDSEKLYIEIEEAGDSVCTLEKIQISDSYFKNRKMRNIIICPVCREPYPEADGPICRGCQGEAPYKEQNKTSSSENTGPGLQTVDLDNAVGEQAVHDMTGIEPGESKGPEVRAGQEISTRDLCRLQQIGRSRIFVQSGDQPSEDWIHEDNAALAFAEYMAGEHVAYQDTPKEGKLGFQAEINGLLSIDREKLQGFNLVPEVICSSHHGDTPVEKGKTFAGCRAIPLYLHRENLSKALAALQDGPVFEILPFQKMQVGILITGSEVFTGLVEDKFEPVISSKVKDYGCEVLSSEVVQDDRQQIRQCIDRMLDKGVELLVTTAGLSVDPEDVTRHGLLDAGLQDILYGMPVLPGAMTLLGRIGNARVIGVPACALFYKTTSFDLLLPRILAGKEITRKALSGFGEGGFCLGCKICTFPKCPFGR